MSKTVLFQTIQFCISMQFSPIWPIDRTLSGATTPGQNGPGNDGNEWVPCIPQGSSITGTSPSDCLMSYPGHSLGEFYPSAEMQSVYSTTPANRARKSKNELMNSYTLVLVGQQKFTFISFIWTLDGTYRICKVQWLIWMDGERKSKETMLSAHFDDEIIKLKSTSNKYLQGMLNRTL